MLTKYSQCHCAKCHIALKPIAKTIPRVNAFSGLAGGFIGILFYKELGFGVAFLVLPIVLLFNCWVSSACVQFEKMDCESKI
jgi:hypothetical protein